MCGIFAYTGQKENAGEMVIDGLKSLEYRGYDSWGIAFKEKTTNQMSIHKEVGKIGDIKKEDLNLSASNLAIGQAGATHGGVTKTNAHPHFSENKDIVLVHNGICENYLELKNQLVEKGHKFVSETDTEVIAHLISEIYKTHDFQTSVQMAIEKMEGRYALLVINQKDNTMIAAREGSPLILGVGSNNDFYVASDIPAFLKHTKKVIYLDDNQMAVIKDGKSIFYDTDSGREIQKRTIDIEWDVESAEKGDFEHFMMKEIMEQKDSLRRAINQDTNSIEKAAQAIKSSKNTYFVGCGTAGKVAMIGQYLFAHISKKQVHATFGSEFLNFEHFIDENSLMISISQSGETADTLEGIKMAKEKGAKIGSIVNVETSTMARESDIVIPIKAGPEKAVASTKATTAQMAILTLLAYACDGGVHKGKQLLITTIAQINDMLNPRYEEHILKLAEKIKDVESMYIIGRGLNYPIALEAAIKLQEVSYIHAEGFAGGELKHGPIALISKGTPVLTIVANDHKKKEILSNAIEVKARGGYIIGVSPEYHEVFDYWIKVPDSGMASPIVNIIPIQILAYQLAVLRQNNPDMPRNLAKSVTVK